MNIGNKKIYNRFDDYGYILNIDNAIKLFRHKHIDNITIHNTFNHIYLTVIDNVIDEIYTLKNDIRRDMLI